MKDSAKPAAVVLYPEELAALCALMMCSDPWPEGVDRVKVEGVLNRLARTLDAGTTWIEAYHRISPSSAGEAGPVSEV